MTQVLPDEVARFVTATAPDPDETLIEMDERAAAEGFPHVGHEVGAFLRLLARLVDAERAFEFGSGYGYSAYWTAQALPGDGEIVLTEIDEDELDLAREYMAEGDFDATLRFELGDALETVERYDGPFDVVLIDHQKSRYREAFEAIRPKVPVGGAIVADNAITAAPIEFETLLELIENEGSSGGEGEGEGGGTLSERAAAVGANEETRGVAAYLEAVTDDPAFETLVLPIGEGIAVSYRVE